MMSAPIPGSCLHSFSWAARHRLRVCALVLIACGLGLAGSGCLARRPRPATHPPRMRTGASREAVVHEPINTEHTDSGTLYSGEGWTLTVGDGSGWREASDGKDGTLKLVREAAGIRLSLALRAYPIRRDMPVETFLTAHAMWMVEEEGPRVEYEQDEQSGQWHGYAIRADQEAYYAFFCSDDRGYVIQASASSGVLSREEVEEFSRIVKAFRCYPRRPSRSSRSPDDASLREAS